jgi:serine/threonine-protein kinase
MVADDDIKPGDVLAGRYRVKRVLGRGGMGIVVAATDVELHRSVAVKLLLSSLGADKEAVARFRREARAAVLLTSEHSVRVHDVGELPTGIPFMVMELLAGNDLDDIIRERHRIPPAEAVDYVLQTVEAIAEAHANAIVHRDLKPRNIFLTRKADGTPLIKVLDFGLAKAPLKPGERGITDTLAVMGSPEYMSPEQMRGTRDVDPRSDIWALGATLYELLTGECPFTAPSTPELFIKVFQDQPRPPHELFADIPFGLSRAVLRCLEKAPEGRYQNVAELAAAIEEFAPLDAHGSANRIDRVLHAARPTSSSEHPPPLVDASPAETRVIEPQAGDAGERRAETVTSASFDSAPRRALRRGIWKSVGVGVGVAAAIIVTLLVWAQQAPVPAVAPSVEPVAPPTPIVSAPVVPSPEPASDAGAAPRAEPASDAGAAPRGANSVGKAVAPSPSPGARSTQHPPRAPSTPRPSRGKFDGGEDPAARP